MTGRELILYILENHLEDEPIVKDGIFVGLIPIHSVAEQNQVGIGTISAWVDMGLLEGCTIDNKYYLFAKQKWPSVD